MIEIKNVTKKYNGIPAIDRISFNVDNGTIFAFIGHNGAGKTTTIKSIVGINDFDSGEILINGISIKDNPIQAKKIMAYVPDNPDLYENMTGLDFINFMCDIYDVSLEDRKVNIEKYSKMFEMDGKLGSDISSYSHGMKQKVALIAALSHNPDVLIMDEPFVGLDPKAGFDMKEVQGILGHASLNTLSIYTHTSIDTMLSKYNSN